MAQLRTASWARVPWMTSSTCPPNSASRPVPGRPGCPLPPPRAGPSARRAPPCAQRLRRPLATCGSGLWTRHLPVGQGPGWELGSAGSCPTQGLGSPGSREHEGLGPLVAGSDTAGTGPGCAHGAGWGGALWAVNPAPARPLGLCRTRGALVCRRGSAFPLAPQPSTWTQPLLPAAPLGSRAGWAPPRVALSGGERGRARATSPL